MSAQPAKKKPFKKVLYRGFEIDQLLEKNMEEVVKLMNARQRRRFAHGISSKYDRLVKKLQKAVKECPYGEKPKAVKTHLRNCIIVPEMVGGVCEVYGGKYWNPVEIKTDMVGSYLAEYSLTYKPIRHGKVGHGATRGSKFASLK
eukprot:NODE_6110_length_530_cov_134.153846_g5353_i0.p1 GENE.NODE_6110_length_530_cov_134.153846_g5353_i0~~NODE_6110_length_530_cov_134.153846_g5353_i0.p1  ORF type:complete len:145 (+),score=28.27 NODE_6110_length_530_cov_134.153846_g5353_i0:53-487(+)